MAKKASPEQIKSVCEEIQHFINRWNQGDVSEREIRAGSVSLRRLLVHGELLVVWNALIGNKKFHITAREILVDDPNNLKLHDLYTCSQVKHKGRTVYGARVYLGKAVMTPIGDGKFRDDTIYGIRDREKKFNLDQFMQSICIVAEGQTISRSWLVQYVANSLGGAHFGSPKKKSEQFVTAMKNLKKFDVGEMPVSVRELLGIAQGLCQSSSTNQLMVAYTTWASQNPNVRIA